MRIIQTRVAKAPDPQERPRLAHFLWERGMSFRDAALALKPLTRSHEYLRLICLPFGHPKRLQPDAETLARIIEWTGGVIGEADFAPPQVALTPGERALKLGRAS
jgi:hypothetical protein